MKKILICAALLLCAFSAFSDPFNRKLSSDERSRLEKGEVVIRNIDKMKHICVNETDATRKIIKTMKDLNPNYTAEIIQVRPYKGNEDLLSVIKSSLLNISDYTGIPYWSVRVQKWYELYDSATITKQETSGNETTVLADLEMSPFGIIHATIHLEEGKDSLYYDMTNQNKLRYHDKFDVIKPENMKSAISVFRDGDNWVLYAIGGVNTYKVFFLEDRVETSFINRIKTFCNFIFSKI
ncbi:MAG: hypothetical protein K6G80_05180 [Treponema sp.]|nr:hypothetical protein [Treponema sp.]